MHIVAGMLALISTVLSWLACRIRSARGTGTRANRPASSRLKELFETGNSKRVPANFAEHIARMLEVLDEAENLHDLAIPGYDSSAERGRAATVQDVGQRTVADDIST